MQTINLDGDRLGEAVRDGDRIGLRYERTLGHAPEKVWRALTESEHLAAWFPTDIEGALAEGAEVVLRFWPPVVAKYDIAHPVVAGRIVTWRPHSQFAFDWGGDLVRFELDPDGAGTRLTVTVLLGEESLRTGSHRAAAGYHACLHLLAGHLDGRGPMTVVDVDPAPLEARYEQVLG